MLIKPLHALKKGGLLVKSLMAYLSLIKNPTAAAALELESAMTGLTEPRDLEGLLTALRGNPDTARMLDEKYQSAYTLEDIAHYPDGTLGRALYEHMTKNNLQPFPPVHTTEDALYFRRRFFQTHDIHHVLTGYPATLYGELAILGFYLGEFAGKFHQNKQEMMRYPTLLVAANLLHGVLFQPDYLPGILSAFVDGWKWGHSIRSFWSVHWEEMWDRPVEDIRREFALPSSGLACPSA